MGRAPPNGSTVSASTAGGVNILAEREQRGSTVFSCDWKHVVEPRQLAHHAGGGDEGARLGLRQ
jgi:hypothetical protein